jgi:hypothetical protein
MRLPRVLATDPRRSVPVVRGTDSALRDAACIGHDPALFDITEYPRALAALAVCGTCTIKVQCLAVVRPGPSWFDGVAGGIVWRNGYQVRRDNTSRGRARMVDDGTAV